MVRNPVFIAAREKNDKYSPVAALRFLTCACTGHGAAERPRQQQQCVALWLPSPRCGGQRGSDHKQSLAWPGLGSRSAACSGSVQAGLETNAQTPPLV